VITSVEDARRLAREGDRLLDRESFEEAAQAYAGAIALEPMYLMAHYGLGRARRGQKDYAAATAAFEQARRVFEKRTAILPPPSDRRPRQRVFRQRSHRGRPRPDHAGKEVGGEGADLPVTLPTLAAA
jgi:tetratricopeptide (TPR) repeat protein